MLEKVFAPLGYELSWEEYPLDEHFPEWGLASYVNLFLRGKQRLRDLLRHVYVLIPVFDFRKHYWIGEGEVEKLLDHGEGWLEKHPERNFITRRYFTRLERYTRLALERMDNGEGAAASAEDTVSAEESEEPSGEEAGINNPAASANRLSLNEERMAAVVSELKASGAESVLDLGCGEGNLLRLLIKEKCFTALAGCDVSLTALDRAAEKLSGKPLMAPERKKRLSLFQGSLCYRDRRFKGYDAVVITEVIEHLDEGRLPSLCSVVFGETAPKTVIVTTPNREYNINYPHVKGGLRHPDHRFEWSRAEFRAWAEETAARYGYSVRTEEIGQRDEERGSPAQMGVFTRSAAHHTKGAAHQTKGAV
jgi:3' terminal RNA ribose 2'-O-methyltransferase Hen1